MFKYYTAGQNAEFIMTTDATIRVQSSGVVGTITIKKPSGAIQTIPLRFTPLFTQLDDFDEGTTVSLIVEHGFGRCALDVSNDVAITVVTTGGAIISKFPLSELTDIAIFEAPYAMLSSAQKTATATSGGFPMFAVSRNNADSVTYAVYSSATKLGKYTKVLDKQAFTPSAQLIGTIGLDHQTLSYGEEKDFPATINPNTIGLIVDANGQQEFVKLSTNTVVNIGNETVKALPNVDMAIYDSVPIQVNTEITARIFLMDKANIDPNLKADGTTLFYKITPQNSAFEEFPIDALNAIPLKITSRASKPYPVPFVSFRNQYFPTHNIGFDDVTFQAGSRSKDETNPTGFFNPTGVIDAGVVRKIDVEGLNGSATPIRTYTIDATTNAATYFIGDRATDGARFSTKYTVYAEKAGIKSVPYTHTVIQRPAAQNTANAIALTQSTTNIIAALTMDASLGGVSGKGNEINILFVEIGGTATVNFDNITFPAGIEKIAATGSGSYFYIQMPRTQLNFSITIPFTGPAGSTVIVTVGGESDNRSATITTA